ncbi:phospholipase [Helicobacter sp. MIT 03-1614]|uniref:phospholipase A n=1 Tax=Helicobacter sp. MIT 03-1614 TaxID=1548147 RepID=UPI000514207A|nr:phospholipase A [Helicobacter sp. MIT 03-1614]TLD90436.1 phospholipase [Helicobacter sp. MIT 03-1614]
MNKWCMLYLSVGLSSAFADSLPNNLITHSQEKENKKPYLLLYPHNAVYILPFYHSLSEPTPSQSAYKNKDTEIKFQFSFKLAVFNELFSPYGYFYFAYTQTAWFQSYNQADSRPFRDVDYQPELFYSYERPISFLGGSFKNISLGYNHISNGERALRSRTQNRILLNMRWEYDIAPQSVFGIKLGTWVYIGKHLDGFMADNPDLALYRGYNDIGLYYKSNRNLLELYMRPPIARRYYPYFELGYTLRVSDNIGIYVQYINGYGDNMFEYKMRSERIGVGFRLWDK